MEKIKNNEDTINNMFQHDRIKILNLLPAEMWWEVFYRIDDPEDKKSFSNSSLFFRKMFRSQRTQFLFQSVWKVLGKKFEQSIAIPRSLDRDSEPTEPPNIHVSEQVFRDDENLIANNSDDDDLGNNNSDDDGLADNNSDDDSLVDRNSDDDDLVDNNSDDEDLLAINWDDEDLIDSDLDGEDEAVKMHRAGIVKSLVKRLRLVCKSWNEGVAHFYQNHYLHYQQQDYIPPTKSVEGAIEAIITEDFSESSQVVKFLNHFATTHEGSGTRNPFFGRSIAFKFPLDDREDVVVYKNNLRSILIEYGHHLWHCTITFTEQTHRGIVACYHTLRELLELMPNLKVLRVTFDHSWLLRKKNDPKVLELARLQAVISAQPLPKLNDLQLLSVWRARAPIFQELIRSYHHLSTLDITDQYSYDIYSVPLPKLTTLYVSCRTQADFDNLMNPLVKWRLQKLCVSFDTNKFISWQHIFTQLEENFTDSLTELDISLPEATNRKHKIKLYQESQALQLNFPHLKFLRISISNLCCLDFLLSLSKSLLHLEIALQTNVQKDNKLLGAHNLKKASVIKLSRSIDSPIQCNIWLLFPKLNWVLIEQYIETGKSYLARHQKWSQSREQWKSQATRAENNDGAQKSPAAFSKHVCKM